MVQLVQFSATSFHVTIHDIIVGYIFKQINFKTSKNSIIGFLCAGYEGRALTSTRRFLVEEGVEFGGNC